MKKKKYIIVGAEVDNPRRYLQKDGTITETKGQDGTPLTVEYIGETFVELSEKQPSAAELASYQDKIKAALRAIAGPHEQELTAAEEDEILENTEVEILLETREKNVKAPDKNKRILVVPVRETLEPKQKFVIGIKKPGDFPELTYNLDHLLILMAYRKTILDIVKGFAHEGHKDWTSALQNALNKYVEKRLNQELTPPPNADPALAEIMKKPVRAFHRSVGIYTTTMCL